MNKYALAACALSATMLLSPQGSALAQVPNQLVFTEISAMELTATLNGNPVGAIVNLGQDHWTWSYPGVGVAVQQNQNGIRLNWIEPAPDTGYNTLSYSLALDTFTYDILSDQASANGFGGTTADGTVGATLSLYGLEVTGATRPLLLQADVIYRDQGDGNSVPDVASTFGLLVLSLASLPFIRKIRS